MSLYELTSEGKDAGSNPASLTWGTTSNTTGATSTTDGKANTKTLVELGTNYTAATACSLYSTEGTSAGDWYLPASEELSTMYENFKVIQEALDNLTDNALALDSNNGYWSSTESIVDRAYYLYTGYGDIYSSNKDNDNYVRAFLSI